MSRNEPIAGVDFESIIIILVHATTEINYSSCTMRCGFLLPLLLQLSAVQGFTSPASTSALFRRQQSTPSFSKPLAVATSTSGNEAEVATKAQKKLDRKQLVKQEGGRFAFDTKYGALNPFAIYYGLVSIGLGLIWFMALSACQLMYKLTGNRVDRKRRIPVFLSHVWGTLLMTFTGCFPKVENGDIVKNFHKR